jgi:hypothetical protein
MLVGCRRNRHVQTTGLPVKLAHPRAVGAAPAALRQHTDGAAKCGIDTRGSALRAGGGGRGPSWERLVAGLDWLRGS